MKPASLLPSTGAVAAIALLAAAVFAAAPSAQPIQDQPAAPASGGAQQGAPAGGSMGRMRNYPPPTNLKVLPNDLTGAQVREIMQRWAGSLGAHCGFCHAADPHKLGPNGRPELDFASDAKPEKRIARIMYTMTEQMNQDYIKKAMDLDPDGEGKPVTCGTCHRGHEMPEEFVMPKEERHGGPGGMPGTAPSAGGVTPPGN